MRQLTAAVAVVTVGLLVAACNSSQRSGSSTTPTRPVVALGALDGLLLSPAEIDTAMSVTGMTTQQKSNAMSNDIDRQWPDGWKWPAECLYAFSPAEGPVYGTAFTAVRGQLDGAPAAGPNEFAPSATQAVVLFPSADNAAAFFTTSSQGWPACADHQFTTPGDADSPETAWHVAPVSTTNGTLSTTVTMTMTGAANLSGACQRALTVRNNVAIDIATCGNNPGDSAVDMANRIAAKVG